MSHGCNPGTVFIPLGGRAEEPCRRATGRGQPRSPPQQALRGPGEGEGFAHPGPTMATPEPTLTLGISSARRTIDGMQPHHPNFLQMMSMEIPAKGSQPPQDSTQTGQTFLKEQQRSSFSVPVEMLSCPTSPWLVPLPSTLLGSHGHHRVSGGLLKLSFIREHGTTELFMGLLMTTT